ncbi:MAG: T9SS type A sorting domain-containing protein, partial [Flavobacteriales bacterium]|nr:T9SS type A sorting domain-containing protein [Flavobacteriales bacterium]
GNIALQEFRRVRANLLRDVSKRGGVFQLKEHGFTADYLDDNTLKYNLYHSTGEDINGRAVPINSVAHQIGSDNVFTGLSGGVAGITEPNILVESELTTDDLIVDFNTYEDYWVVVDKLEADRGSISNFGNGIGIGSALSDSPEDPWESYGHFYAVITSYEISPALTEISVDHVQGNDAKLNITSHKDAMGYYVVVPSSAMAPSSQEIVDGVDYNGVSVVASGAFPMEAGLPATAQVLGLDLSTTYHAYAVGVSNGDDLLGRRTLPIEFTTTSNSTPAISGEMPQTVCLGDEFEDMPLIISDSETAADDLLLTVTSSNTALVAEENIVLSGEGENRTVSVIPSEGESGSTEIKVTVEDLEGATASVSLNFTVSELMVAETANVPAGCSDSFDGSVSVSVSGGTAPYEFLWSTGATTPSVDELNADTYSVEVTDANGCEGNAEVEVTVLDETAPTIDCSNLTAMCEGVYEYGDLVSVEDNCSATFTQTAGPEVGEVVTPGQYEVEFTAEDASGNTSICTTTLDVVAYPEVNLGADTTIAIGNTITLVAGNDPDHSYLWSTGETTNEITITVEEDVTVSVTVTNALGCDDSDEIDIISTINMGTATSANGSTFKLFPNPGTDRVNLSFGLNEPLSKAAIAIYDLQGKQLQTTQVNVIENGQVVSLDISQLQQGMYIATIATEEERMTVRFSKK